jgi:hypothetical protein
MNFPLPRPRRAAPGQFEKPAWTARSAVKILRTEAELSEALARAVQTEKEAVARTEARISRYDVHSVGTDLTAP